MEKDIEILKDMRDNIYGAMQFEDDYQVTELEEKQFNALNLAIKSIKRVKELEEENKKYPIKMTDEQYKKVIDLAQKDIKEELDRQINTRIINEEFIENNFISKDKIKEKIEELENEIEKFNNDSDFWTDTTIILQEQIEVLQELLEE